MSVEDLLRRIVGALVSAGVPYMLTGSYASSLHSIPRATRDIDIVIFPNREQLTGLIERLPADSYHADLTEALEALRVRGQFNVIDYASGWKVDFIIPPFDEFNLEEFDRRTATNLDGLELTVVSAEDIIVAKLLWAKAGQSDRQIEDAAGVLRSQAATLNLPYIERWVRKLDLQEQWQAARASVG
ncbi:MAG: hypothetical protein JWO97_1589 [Acidobacteria bacterium]|nr:hypothetical protein [Acidobacteriota bacterium]